MSTARLTFAALAWLWTCGAGTAQAQAAPADELTRRLEGVWAHDADSCQLYRAGQTATMDARGRDADPARHLSIVEIRNGRLDLKAQGTSCQITKSTRTGAGRYKFQAMCQAISEVNGQKRAERGTMTFTYDERLHLQVANGSLPPLELSPCAL